MKKQGSSKIDKITGSVTGKGKERNLLVVLALQH